MLTDKKKDIMRHALGGDSERPGYRNYYVAGPGMDGWSDLEELVADGYMTKRQNHLNEMEKDYVFHVTQKGQEAVGIIYKS